MVHRRLPRLQTRQTPFTHASRDALPAREALRRAQAELEKWQAAFDCHCGNDSDKLRLEIRLAEQKVAEAYERVRKLDPSFNG